MTTDRPGRTVTRPNGKVYRPRKLGLRYVAWTNDPEPGRGVIVLGLLDDRYPVREHAAGLAAYWFDEPRGHYDLTNPQPGWWRDAYDRRGERAWIRDDVRGAPGIMYTWTERPV